MIQKISNIIFLINIASYKHKFYNKTKTRKKMSEKSCSFIREIKQTEKKNCQYKL